MDTKTLSDIIVSAGVMAVLWLCIMLYDYARPRKVSKETFILKTPKCIITIRTVGKTSYLNINYVNSSFTYTSPQILLSELETNDLLDEHLRYLKPEEAQIVRDYITDLKTRNKQ